MKIGTITRVSVGIGIIVLVTIATIAWLMGGGGSSAGMPVPPPRTVSFDSVAAEGGITSGEIISIQPEQLKNAGIQIVLPEEMMTSESFARSAVGVVEADSYKDIPVVTVASGRVVEVRVEVGTQVAEGQILATLESTDFTNAQGAFIVARAELDNARNSSSRALRLAEVNDESKSLLDSAKRDFDSRRAILEEATSRRDRYERLFKAGAVSRQMRDEETRRYIEVKSDFEEASRRLERATSILEIGNEARARVEEAERRLRRAEGEFSEARRRLLIFGLTDSQIADLKTLEDVMRIHPLRAPIGGEVTLRNLTKGEFLDAGKQVLRVTDLRSLWVVGQLTEADVSEIKLGTQGEIALQTGGEVIGSGRVTYISPALNPSTRTAQVRVTVPNTGKRLKLGSYVRILFESDESKTRVVPSIPSGAVQLLKGNPVVFIPKENIGDFEVRVVRIGSAVKGKVPVLDGLELSEKVVDTGSFLLRAEYLKRNVN